MCLGEKSIIDFQVKRFSQMFIEIHQMFRYTETHVRLGVERWGAGVETHFQEI